MKFLQNSTFSPSRGFCNSSCAWIDWLTSVFSHLLQTSLAWIHHVELVSTTGPGCWPTVPSPRPWCMHLWMLFYRLFLIKCVLHMKFQANADDRNVVWCREKRVQFICGSLQTVNFRDPWSRHWCLSGSASSEQRSELPRPAIYSFQSEHSQYVFMRGCSALYASPKVSVWMFRSANTLARQPLWYTVVCLPGEHPSNAKRRNRKENLEKTKWKLRLWWLGIGPGSLYYIKVKPGAVSI